MADIQLQHEAVTAAVEEMQQAAQQMHSNLDELAQVLQANRDKFQGDAANAFIEFQQAVSRNDSAMTGEFASGAQILSDMHDTLSKADSRAAQGFHQ